MTSVSERSLMLHIRFGRRPWSHSQSANRNNFFQGFAQIYRLFEWLYSTSYNKQPWLHISALFRWNCCLIKSIIKLFGIDRASLPNRLSNLKAFFWTKSNPWCRSMIGKADNGLSLHLRMAPVFLELSLQPQWQYSTVIICKRSPKFRYQVSSIKLEKGYSSTITGLVDHHFSLADY